MMRGVCPPSTKKTGAKSVETLRWPPLKWHLTLGGLSETSQRPQTYQNLSGPVAPIPVAP